MGGPRLAFDRIEVYRQIQMAATAIVADPSWPGLPSGAEVQQAADDLKLANENLFKAEQALRAARFEANSARERALDLLRRVDYVTDSLYGPGGVEKGRFGVRPKDQHRNKYVQTPIVKELALSDGPVGGTILANWHRVPRATYEVQWYADPECTSLLGAAAATRSRYLIENLGAGTQVWVRVRALRSRQYGEWSDVSTRIANV